MAIFRSFKTLISRNRNPKITSSRTFFTTALSSSFASPYTSLPPSLYTDPSVYLRRRHHFLFRPNFLSPIAFLAATTTGATSCPLFLSSPPWKLSQSATPLHLPQELALLHVKALSSSFSYKLGLNPESTAPKLLLNGPHKKQFGDVQLAGGVRDNFLNFPNFISFSRLLSGPLLAWMIIQDMYVSAFLGLAISGASDWLDGYMARKMGINSVVGSYLDPLADKVLIGSVALAMVERGLLHSGLVAVVVLRDLALIGGVAYKRAKSLEWKCMSWFDFFDLDGTRPQKVEPLMISKLNTAFQLVLVAAALLQPEFGSEETQGCITYLSWLVALTTVASTAAYGVQHLRTGSLYTKKS